MMMCLNIHTVFILYATLFCQMVREFSCVRWLSQANSCPWLTVKIVLLHKV